MTVPSDTAQPPRVTYVEDGATLVRAIPFTFEDPTDIVVTRFLPDGSKAILTLNTDYTITGGLGLSGSATMVGAGDGAPSPSTLQIDRDTPHDQLSDYENGDAFPADRVEGDFDKLIRIVQELARDLLSVHQVQQIIAAMLQQGTGITITPNATGTALVIASSVDVFAIMANTLAQGAGVTITVDDALQRITISAEGIENLPDCVELSGDQQTFTGGESSGAPLSTADVITIVRGLLESGAGINVAWDATNSKVEIINTSLAGYTDADAVAAVDAKLINGTLIQITSDGAGIHIATTALDPSYRGLAVVAEAGAFDFVDAHGGCSIIYTGGPASATLQLDTTHALSDGWGTVIRNKGTGTLTIVPIAGVSLELNGAVVSSSVALAIGGIVTINRWAANDFTAVGPGANSA